MSSRAIDAEQVAIESAREADAATRLYDRIAWSSYVTILLVLPLVVLVFRLHMQPWHYYLAGALFLVGALLIIAMDIAAMVKLEQLKEAAQRVQRCGNCSQ